MAAPLFADYLAERRILRRKLSYWRIAAFAAVILGVAIASQRLLGPDGSLGFTPHIARLAIEGIITGDRETLKLIQKIEDSKAAEAVLISIDSPGGTTSGAERLYDAIRRLSAKKPTVAVVGSMAASGGYVAALGTDRIVALGNALVGSIGVLVQYPNFAKLLDTVGVKVEDVKSSPLKASPNGFEPTSPEARAALAGVSDADMMKGWKLLAGGKEIFTLPKIACIRGMCMNHMIHHRAQMTVCFRLVGVPVPGLYGPSADEGQDSTAAAAN